MDASSLRQLPSINVLIEDEAMESVSRPIRTLAAQKVVDKYRTWLLEGKTVDFAALRVEVIQLAEDLESMSQRPAVNMTGVVLHTGLGRARMGLPMSYPTYSNLEIELETGSRGDRQSHVRGLLQRLTGAEDALVVNNGAAAILLTLRALCKDREVVLSVGQMVEIGGSFRIPEVVAESGCTLRPVGCTNRTRLEDYAKETREETAAYLRCHTSNFAVAGFTGEPTPSDLAKLARDHGLLLIDDCGSGCLVDTTDFGLPHERTLPEALADGADIVTASGDKLLGGPQAGLILGRTELVRRIAEHPLARAVRIDKLSLLELEATLRHYQRGSIEAIPTWRYISRSMASVEANALQLHRACPEFSHVADGETVVGGGSLPGCTVPTKRVGLNTESPEMLARWLRHRPVPVFGRIERDTVWLDPRTCEDDEVAAVTEQLRVWGAQQNL